MIAGRLFTQISKYAAHVAATVAHGATGAVVGTTNSQALSNKSLGSALACGNYDVSGAKTVSFNGLYSNGTKTTSWTCNWNNGQVQSVTLGGNTSATFTAPPGPGTFYLHIYQDATGNRTLGVPTGRWPGGTAGTLTKTASARDLLVVHWDGTTYHYDLVNGYGSVTTPTL